MREPKRYLGIELAGAKNQKTALAALEYYPKEKKIFLLDIFERITVVSPLSGDEALLELIDELREGVARVGVNVPLGLPPCIECTRKTCPLPKSCRDPSVKWMRATTNKARKGLRKLMKVPDFTPYTQRPVELFVRYHVFPHLPESHRFEIDETLGGNRAPLTARMHFLKRHMQGLHLTEVWPKLSVSVLALDLGLNRRIVSSYRHLEQGVHAREQILEQLTEKHGIFIYERDIRKLSHSLASFDAFICAYTALLADIGLCTAVPKGFPEHSGWVEFPDMGNDINRPMGHL
jgi:hypothetical protein